MTQNIAGIKLIEGLLWDVEAGLQTNDLQGIAYGTLDLVANYLERAKADMSSNTFRKLEERYSSLRAEYDFASNNPDRFRELANENSLYYTFSYEEVNSQD